MRRLRSLITLITVLGLLAGGPAAAAAPKAGPALVAVATKPWVGDLDGMIERRMVRVLVVYSKTFYFVDQGTQRGASYDVFKAFEDELNETLKTKHVRVH